MKEVIMVKTTYVTIAWLGAELLKVVARTPGRSLTTTWQGTAEDLHPELVHWHVQNVTMPDDTWAATEWLSARAKAAQKGATK